MLDKKLCRYDFLKILEEETACDRQNVSEYNLWYFMITPEQDASSGNASDL
jgi:hypothetical protein